MQLPIDLLRTFVAVADSGSFTRAGEAVSRTQSAVSQQIQRLEDELGRKVFSRSGREIALTPDGETLLPYARRILHAHDEAVAALTTPELTGAVRLGAPDDLAVLLPDILARFAAAYPLVQVELHCDPSRILNEALARHELDIILTINADPPLRGEVVARERVVWIASPRHLVHEQDPLPLAVFQMGTVYRRWAAQALDAAGRAWRVAYRSPSLAGILAAVKAGLAVAPVGESAVDEHVLVLGPAQGFPELPAAYIAVTLAEGPRSKAIERLAEVVAEGIRARSAQVWRLQGTIAAG